MERLRRRDLRALNDFLRATYPARDREAFVDEVLGRLPHLVASDVTAYNEIDPRGQIRWIYDPPQAIPFGDGQQVFEEHIPQHPLIAHYTRTGDRHARRISDFLTRRQFHRLGLYQEFFKRVGVEYQMVLPLATPPPNAVGFCVHRRLRDFSERERLLFDLLRPHLAEIYRSATEISETRRDLALLERGITVLGRGVMGLDRGGHVRWANEIARRWLGEYFGAGSGSSTRLPRLLQRWLHQELQARDGVDDPLPVRRPLAVSGESGRLVVRLLLDVDRALLVMEEERTKVPPRSLERYGLTRREAEVLAWIAEGKTNAEVALILGTRRRTVSKHLERVYQKLSVETRTAAARMAFAALRAPAAER